MKKTVLILLVLSKVLMSCNPHKVVSQNSEDILFAKIKLDKIVFVKDTIKFKKRISESIFSKETNVKFDKIEILTQNVIDNKRKKVFYYVIMYDYSNKLKTARVLTLKNNDELVFTKNNAFEQTYISCVGKKSSCKPKIFYKDLKWFWICGNNLKECSINSNSNNECKVFNTILL